ncbi:hypothetical protein [Hymenobacter glacialis]|uniref:Septum formation inhibitor Maf n=1 Tax=Hymenobacter glacialis TaxID=1908236 RepID=A0A1G1T1D6_9BACT|nr:hypothetical protein [Hymenobacter glacialis]OGX84647.1 hypothetical protein BEN48_02600 [Hymenobacter glacialis]
MRASLSLLLWVPTLLLIGAQCSSAPAETQAQQAAPLPPEFGAYWFQGKAELTSYDLTQARYGELHQGEAVLIFVSEDLSRKKQVKLDNPAAAGADRLPVLKLNFNKKFNTGIYPYSILTSTFTPLNLAADPHSPKVSMSMQEWCGHVFTQLNLGAKEYRITQKSYFESEGDTETKIDVALLEDELWNRIRLNPAGLPTGNIQLVPGAAYCRMQHLPLHSEAATATLSTATSGSSASAAQVYTVAYAGTKQHTLAIRFEKAFPHRILGWEESHLDGFGPAPRLLTTRATQRRSIKLDYWRTHNNADAAWRDSLGLSR